MPLNRRAFLQTTALSAALAALPMPAAAESVEGMPYRMLGRTGEKVSLLCLGGSHVGHPRVPEAEVIRIIRHAMDAGVNFLDNAWQYHNGRSEELMGKALKDGYRDRAYLMTKNFGRTRQEAIDQLETSLRRLDVDVIDLYQVHSISYADDPRTVYEEGVIDVLVKARDEGKIRHIGFTGHFQTAPHREMIERGFPWETLQMPLSCFDYHFESFTREVLPLALEKEIGVIAMKTLGGSPGSVMQTGLVTVDEALTYAMSLPVASVCCGMQSMEELEQNLAIAKAFAPMPAEAREELLARVHDEAHDGRHEPHKTRWHRRG